MKKVLTVIAVSALALGMSSAIAAQNSVKANQTQAAAKKAPSYLFVLSANKAQLKKGPSATALLVIKASNLDRTIASSDRPQRSVKYINTSNLAKNWSKGLNNFTDDPPNAVLSAANMKPQIVVINGIQVTDTGVVLKLTGISLGASSIQLTDPVITADWRIMPCEWLTETQCKNKSGCAWPKTTFLDGCGLESCCGPT